MASGVIMSKFNQTLIPAVAAVATVEAYVNVYRDENGNIRPGSRVFRTEKNAANHARSEVGNEFVGVEKLTITR